ncbi:unnamed protein product [Owenia fusiformis]|uniref:Mitochondrial enolase superfamily member 1 n=1 Tax=Owenia fusiformis TaxID=6347 RepID=A0A8J1Y267_OWEFU|nr:unnamed protein product [Owenia fusiformis]
MAKPTKITGVDIKDIRFPTSLGKHGSDAMHGDPDYSCGYVIISTDTGLQGHGLTFTLGRGTHIVCAAIKPLTRILLDWKLSAIYDDFAGFWREITNEQQLRWLGPEKGVMHLATAAIVNALWDLWAKIEGKPVWKLLVDMEPEKIISLIDFRYIEDALSKEEALEILRNNQAGKAEREKEIRTNGYPAYTTSAGWLGYSNDEIKQRLATAKANGFSRFKFKVGSDLQDDIRRLEIVRKELGPDTTIMVDANQKWGVDEAIEWMGHLVKYNLLWIEEPTSPDDVLGHAAIAKALEPYGCGVATGECCQNRVMFKQFLQAKGLQFCQIDSCRLGGVNEIIAVLLMAKKFNVPVCPHAGGVGLCEMVQHLSIFDYISISATLESRMTESADHLFEHFVNPVVMKNGCYTAPLAPGYSTELSPASIADYTYPEGNEWQRLFKEGEFVPLDVDEFHLKQ